MGIRHKEPGKMMIHENDSSVFVMLLKMFGNQLLQVGPKLVLVSRMAQFLLEM